MVVFTYHIRGCRVYILVADTILTQAAWTSSTLLPPNFTISADILCTNFNVSNDPSPV